MRKIQEKDEPPKVGLVGRGNEHARLKRSPKRKKGQEMKKPSGWKKIAAEWLRPKKKEGVLRKHRESNGSR